MIAKKLRRMSISDMRWATRGKKCLRFLRKRASGKPRNSERFVRKGNTGTRKRKRARRRFEEVNIRVGEA